MCVREGVLGIWMGLGEIKVGVGQWGRALGPFPLPNSLTLNPISYPCATCCEEVRNEMWRGRDKISYFGLWGPK